MFKKLVAAYPMVTISEETAVVYWEQLRWFSPEQVLGALEYHICTNKFFPTIAELYKLARQVPCPHVWVPREGERVTKLDDGSRWIMNHCQKCGDDEWEKL